MRTAIGGMALVAKRNPIRFAASCGVGAILGYVLYLYERHAVQEAAMNAAVTTDDMSYFLYAEFPMLGLAVSLIIGVVLGVIVLVPFLVD